MTSGATTSADDECGGPWVDSVGPVRSDDRCTDVVRCEIGSGAPSPNRRGGSGTTAGFGGAVSARPAAVSVPARSAGRTGASPTNEPRSAVGRSGVSRVVFVAWMVGTGGAAGDGCVLVAAVATVGAS